MVNITQEGLNTPIKAKEQDNASDLKKAQDVLIEKHPEKYFKHKGVGIERKLLLSGNLCIALLWIYKFYRHNEFADKEKYYTKNEFFFDTLGTSDYEKIFSKYTQLKHWDLIAPMPTHPTEVKYKKGYWGITEFGIKFCQREVAMPKYAIVQNDIATKHITNPIMIDDALKEIGLDYDDLINL
jgi:hypothetical protein